MFRSIQYSLKPGHEPRTTGTWSKRAELLGNAARKHEILRGYAIKTNITVDIGPPC